ncbi:MAG: hypothetical protein VX899_22315 [Myxococcota bacterium]|nr:hypothetical protein [Myxococcota bacterium]
MLLLSALVLASTASAADIQLEVSQTKGTTTFTPTIDASRFDKVVWDEDGLDLYVAWEDGELDLHVWVDDSQNLHMQWGDDTPSELIWEGSEVDLYVIWEETDIDLRVVVPEGDAQVKRTKTGATMFWEEGPEVD